MTEINVYNCPTDPGSIDHHRARPGLYPRAKGNYVVNWGNTSFDQATVTIPAQVPAVPGQNVASLDFKTGPFASDRIWDISGIRDGTSNTMLMSEVINPFNNGATSDHRGDVYNDDHNCCMYMGYTPPNSTIADQVPGGYCSYPFLNNPRAMPTLRRSTRRGATTRAASTPACATAVSSS